MTKHSRRHFLTTTGSLAILGGIACSGWAKTLSFLSTDDDSSIRIGWFKTNFSTEIDEILKDTPFTIDLIVAVALQETGYLWGPLVDEKLPMKEILSLCVGDTFDFPKRSADAFPKDKAELLAAKDGEAMFRVAREALLDIGVHNTAFRNVAEKYPDKFCHGFGIFQYDLQYFLTNPSFFLEKRWSDFSECLRLFVKDELVLAQARAGYKDKSKLSDEELVYVAIAYNRGRVDPARGFKQGHQNSATGKYYGEYIDEYMSLSKTVSVSKD